MRVAPQANLKTLTNSLKPLRARLGLLRRLPRSRRGRQLPSELEVRIRNLQLMRRLSGWPGPERRVRSLPCRPDASATGCAS